MKDELEVQSRLLLDPKNRGSRGVASDVRVQTFELWLTDSGRGEGPKRAHVCGQVAEQFRRVAGQGGIRLADGHWVIRSSSKLLMVKKVIHQS